MPSIAGSILIDALQEAQSAGTYSAPGYVILQTAGPVDIPRWGAMAQRYVGATGRS